MAVSTYPFCARLIKHRVNQELDEGRTYPRTSGPWQPCDAGEMTCLSSHSTGCSFHVIHSAAVLRGDASRCEQGVGLGSVKRPHDDFGDERGPTGIQ